MGSKRTTLELEAAFLAKMATMAITMIMILMLIKMIMIMIVMEVSGGIKGEYLRGVSS